MVAHYWTLGFFGNLFEGPDLIILLVLGLLLFGKRLPELGKSVGQTIVQFKKGLKEAGDEIKEGAEEEREAPAARARPEGKVLPAGGGGRKVKMMGPVEEP